MIHRLPYRVKSWAKRRFPAIFDPYWREAWSPAMLLHRECRNARREIIAESMMKQGATAREVEAVLSLHPAASTMSYRDFLRFLGSLSAETLEALPIELYESNPSWALEAAKTGEGLEKFLKGKRVALSGPAQHAAESGDGEKIERCDVVVRLNFQWPISPARQPHLGSRCDVLYHCCNGDFDVETLFVKELRDIRFALLEQGIQSRRLKRQCRALGVEVLYLSDFYWRLENEVGSPPSTGLAAIAHLLTFPIASLHIFGMTFGTTPYYEGYRSHGSLSLLESPGAKRAWRHDYAKEARWLKAKLQADSRVALDGAGRLALGLSV